jgi:SAM-dependent methyltransferase
MSDAMLKTDLFDEMCGDGLIPLLASRAGRVVGVDIAHCAVKGACTRNSGVRGVVADVADLPFAGESFDYILSNSTLDHFGSLGEIRGSLAELFRVLRRGGEMTITMDNPANPIVALRNRLPFRLLNRLGITPYYVGMTCGAGELRLLLEEAGFLVLETSAIMHCPRVLAVPLACLLDRFASPGIQRLFLGLLRSFECLGLLPTRALTGHFVAARVVKKGNGALAPAQRGGVGNGT